MLIWPLPRTGNSAKSLKLTTSIKFLSPMPHFLTFILFRKIHPFLEKQTAVINEILLTY